MVVRNPRCNSCALFHNISRSVWRGIIYSHDVGMNESEDGITRRIITELRHFHKSCNRSLGLDVYAKPGYKEELYGSDMDLFVEVSPNQYVWYALQAKVLKSNKTYTTLRDGHSPRNPNYQWEKLTLLEGLTGCKSYYLLYNGVEDYYYNGLDICKQAFDERQFGCSLVEPSTIENYALKTDIRGNYTSPHFNDFHPKHAQPWRILVCCTKHQDSLTKYDLKEILDSNRDLGYKQVTSSKEENENDGNADNQKPENAITNAMKESKWSPDYRIVYSIKN